MISINTIYRADLSKKMHDKLNGWTVGNGKGNQMFSSNKYDSTVMNKERIRWKYITRKYKHSNVKYFASLFWCLVDELAVLKCAAKW